MAADPSDGKALAMIPIHEIRSSAWLQSGAICYAATFFQDDVAKLLALVVSACFCFYAALRARDGHHPVKGEPYSGPERRLMARGYPGPDRRAARNNS